MIQKEQILSVLKKYGFYSLNRAPYLYEDSEKIGIYFVWPNKHFGNLERVMYFEDEEALEEEVYKYWWFITHKEKVQIEVIFDNYEVINPQVTYMYKNTSLTSEIMRKFNENMVFIDPKETIKKRQLLRTSTILILILKEKIRIQNETYHKVMEMSENLNKLKSEFKNKLNFYKKGTIVENDAVELVNEDKDESEKLLKELQEKLLSLNTIEDIRSFINTLYNYLSNLESSTSSIQNSYLLNRYPFELDDMRKKIAILDEAINAKKKLFQPKQDPMILLSSVDNVSQCKKMLDIKVYIEKEKEKIKEKYQQRENIEENILGDYLVDFEKLNISIPPMIESNYYEEFNKNELYASLKETFEKLSPKERSACYVASSFLRDCIIILMEKNLDALLDVKEIIGKLVIEKQIHLFNDAYMTLDHYANAKIRVKYFGILQIKTFETFIESLVEVIRILKNLKLSFKKSFYGYYIDKEKTIVNLFLKNIIHLNKKTSYIARFMPNVFLYYSPVSIVRQLDIINNNELVERKNDTIFLLKERVNIKSNNKKTIVSKYEKDKITKTGYVTIHSLKEINKCTYYEDIIYNKEDGGIYE